MTEKELQELRDKAAAFDFLCAVAEPRRVETRQRLVPPAEELLLTSPNHFTISASYRTEERKEVRFSWWEDGEGPQGFREAVLATVKKRTGRKPSDAPAARTA